MLQKPKKEVLKLPQATAPISDRDELFFDKKRNKMLIVRHNSIMKQDNPKNRESLITAASINNHSSKNRNIIKIPKKNWNISTSLTGNHKAVVLKSIKTEKLH